MNRYYFICLAMIPLIRSLVGNSLLEVRIARTRAPSVSGRAKEKIPGRFGHTVKQKLSGTYEWKTECGSDGRPAGLPPSKLRTAENTRPWRNAARSDFFLCLGLSTGAAEENKGSARAEN